MGGGAIATVDEREHHSHHCALAESVLASILSLSLLACVFCNPSGSIVHTIRFETPPHTCVATTLALLGTLRSARVLHIGPRWHAAAQFAVECQPLRVRTAHENKPVVAVVVRALCVPPRRSLCFFFGYVWGTAIFTHTLQTHIHAHNVEHAHTPSHKQPLYIIGTTPPKLYCSCSRTHAPHRVHMHCGRRSRAPHILLWHRPNPVSRRGATVRPQFDIYSCTHRTHTNTLYNGIIHQFAPSEQQTHAQLEKHPPLAFLDSTRFLCT